MRTSAKMLSLALIAGLIAVGSVPARAADEVGTVKAATESVAGKTDVKKEVKKAKHHHVKKHVKATEAKSTAKEGSAYDAKTNQ